MKFVNVAAAAVTAIALAATPIAASAAPAASKLSLGNAVGARTGAATKGKNAALSGITLGLLGTAVVVGGLAAGGVFDGKNKPKSK